MLLPQPCIPLTTTLPGKNRADAFFKINELKILTNADELTVSVT
jgi:hypothetical protein